MGMEIESDKANKNKVIFLELPMPVYEQLEDLHKRVGGRGVATVIRRIVMAALAEGVSVAGEKGAKANGRKSSKERVGTGTVA